MGLGHLRTFATHPTTITALGGRCFFDDDPQFAGNDEANRLLRRADREGHWAVPGNPG